jgi:hypothetical protein
MEKFESFEEIENFDKQNFVNRVANIPFEKDEATIINLCSFWMRFISYSFNVVASILALLTVGVFILTFSSIGNKSMLVAGVFYLLFSIIGFFLGRTLFKSARAFQDVTNTAIDDQGFLVEGFFQLRKFFLSLGILVIIIIILLIITIIVWSYSSLNNGIG